MVDLATPKTSSHHIPVQELSIQWLSFGRIQKYTDITKQEMLDTPLDDLVQRIMEVYKASRSDNGGKAGQFEHLKDFSFESTHGYTLQVHGRSGKVATVLARELEDGGVSQKKLPKKTSSEFLLFFFRQMPRREIVAVSSGTAWEAIRPCVNYRVPVAIAGRILDPRKISEITRRCLLGNDIKETIHNPSGRELCKISNIYYLVESFKCRVKIDCSLMGLSFFKDTPPEMRIRSGLLRVMKRIALPHYPSLLAHFSEHIHAHGRPAETSTYNNKGELEVFDRDFEFLHFLTPVPSSRDTLNQRAVVRIFHAYQNNCRQEFSFRHKFLQDFLDSDSYEIQFRKGARFHPLPYRPESMEELIGLFFRTDEAFVSSEEALQEAFTGAVFRYQRRDGTKVSDPIIEFVEGEVRDEDGNSYFKIRNMWYKLAVDFHSLLQDDYRSLLRQILIRPGEEGQLPKPWRGNKLQGQLSEAVLRKKFGISKGLRTFMSALKEAQVCFVDEKGNVKHSELVGEILRVEVIQKHRAAINQKLLSQKQLPSTANIKKLFKEDASAIVDALKKKRSVLKESKVKGGFKYVINPFPYPLKSNPLLKGKYDAFAAYLQELHEIYALGVEDEEAYNRAYLAPPYGAEKGYLVFDQICPHNIEPCDVIYFTNEKVYLYHVKETLGQHTRDACSQVLNAAKEIRSALSTQHEDHFLRLMWKKGTGQLKDKKNKKPSPWEAQLKKQLESVGEEAFYSIFRDRSVVFVYAFLDHGQRSIHEEARTKSCLSSADLGLSEKSKTYQKLKELQFLDGSGRLTGKFCASSKERFTKADTEFSAELYDQMRGYSPVSNSTLAKIELLDTAREIRALGFEFKICQIQRPRGDRPCENTPPDQPESDSSDEDSDAASEVSYSSDVAPQQPRAIPDVIPNGPVGFYNVGNSCYINAVLQALFNIPDLRDQINGLDLDDEPSYMTALKQLFQTAGPPAEESLQNFRTLVFEDEDTPLVGKAAQQDAQEFLNFILDRLNWRPLTLSNRYEYEEEIYNSQTEESTHHFSVPIDGEDSFQGTLDSFFALADMKADKKPFKLADSVFATAWQQAICIQAPLPNYLIVHLKRFRNNGTKITTPLEFPQDEQVTIQDEEGNHVTYEIVAFINHHGQTSRSGHYTADVRNFQGEQQWIHCDDDKLTTRAPLNPASDAYIVVLRQTDLDD